MLSVFDGVPQREQSVQRSGKAVRGGRVKRVTDVMFSVLALVFLSPALLVIAAALLILDGRPVLFHHKRIGRNGRTFECLKFRTMRKDADRALKDLLASNPDRLKEWTETQKLTGDPRVHWLGRYLRITSIDELPQLFNVLRGDMSIVGPRPIVAEEMERYGAQIYYYLSMTPGITGLWQVCRRPDTSYEERVRFDVDYYHRRSMPTDLVIIWKTIGVVLFARNEC